ncbi:MAG: hypothetical protein K2N14_04250 [Clostridia bacterium]|nr:hypothetical protein [Clostridia bacterium]
MTKKLKAILLIIVGAVCAALLALAGCKVGRETREEALAGYKAHVTYYANGGFFDGSNSLNVRDLYFKINSANPEGVPFFDITDESAAMKVARTGYDLLGWFIPATYPDGAHEGEIMYTYTYAEGDQTYTVPVYPVYDNGKPVTDRQSARPVFAREGVDEQILEANIRVVASDKAVTSERIVGEGENLIVCADWKESPKILYQLVIDSNATYKDKSGKEYKNGDIIREDFYGKRTSLTPTTMTPLQLDGASFIRTYTDEQLTEVADKAIPRPEGENPQNTVVYSHYLVGGDWSVVSTASDVKSMLNNKSTKKKYYFLNDVDCQDETFTLALGNENSNFYIEGNGFKISNLKFTERSASANWNLSVFGNLTSDFGVNDFTIENISFDITARGNIALYAICNRVDGGAKFENFNITGKIEALVIQPETAAVTNAQNDDRSHWLFGTADATDQAFLDGHSGINYSAEHTLGIYSRRPEE